MCVIDYTRNTLQNHNTIIYEHILYDVIKKKIKTITSPYEYLHLVTGFQIDFIILLMSIELKICNHP